MKVYIIFGLIFLAACTTTVTPNENGLSDKQNSSLNTQVTNICTQEQKNTQICTMEYVPVCGDDGKTYSNKCGACASESVNSWETGECSNDVSDFESCVKAGNPVMESHPEQCSYEGQTYTRKLSLKESCIINEGKFIENASECEGLSKDICESLGGNFNECASACRNNPDAMVCTMQCVLVCEFEKKVECTQEQKNNKKCTREYMPVCGDDDKTYSNKCTACSSKSINSYTDGKC